MLYPEEIDKELPSNGKEIWTPDGWRAIRKVYRTVPMRVWYLRTNSYSLECSGYHLVRSGDNWRYVCDLIVGDVVSTVTGMERVEKIYDTDKERRLYDIEVDHPDGMYYSDGILSHNSTTICARQLILAHIIKQYRGLYVAPSFPMMETYAARYQEMEAVFRIPTGKQNKYSKTYVNNSKLDFAYCLESARDVRGKSVEEVTVDESQNLNPDILPEILYTQTMAKLPMTIYTGTALTTDTLLEQKWRESSMGMWHVRAMDNKHWLNMFDKDVLAKVCDNPLGPICPYTGKRLDVTRGSFVHANKQAMEAGNIGLHIPQCIITDIANSPVQWGKVYNHIKHDDWNKVLQECFGIAVEEGTREISQQDLLRACVLKDTQEGLKLKCNRGYYRLIISGCDWGGSDYNPSTKTKTSYTVHCIMGVAPDGGVDIVHYRRYSGMNYPEIARQIAIDHRDYNGQVIASDFGVGMAYNFEIRKYFPLDRHFIMEYTNPWAPAISLPKGAHMHNQLLINRTEALTNVFRDLKRPVPMIRCRCWEDMSPYLLDWLNMFRVVQESTSGKKSFLYRRPPTKADDALHAFTFAYVLVKFYRGESLIDDSNLVQRINAVLRSPRRDSPTVQEFTRAVLGDMPWSIPIN